MVWGGIIGQGGEQEGCMMRIGEGEGRIGHGGGRTEIVIVVGVYSPMCRFWFWFWFWLQLR